jgi:hypothetical protein
MDNTIFKTHSAWEGWHYVSCWNRNFVSWDPRSSRLVIKFYIWKSLLPSTKECSFHFSSIQLCFKIVTWYMKRNTPKYNLKMAKTGKQ